MKTVELIEEEVPWLPSYGRLSRKSQVPIRVTVHEISLQRRVRQAGGTWDARRKVWHVPYENVIELGLEERIVVSDVDGDHEQD